MAEGDSAAKQISNIVLLESSFSDLPDILFEGRRVVNNMFRVASLFFIKTLYSFFVAVLCALSPIAGAVIVFPFIALQITAIDQVLEGYPTFFMSFESDKNKVTKNFLRSSLLKALPQAIMIAVALAIIFAWTTRQGWDNLEMATLMYHVLGTITLIGLFRACLPFSKLRAFLFATSALGFYVSAFILGRWFSDILQIDVISDRALIVLLIIGSACIAVAYILHRVQRWRNLGVLK
jgi:cation-transporting ATPase E